MKTRKLIKASKAVSEIGLGCWQLGGDFGPITDYEGHAILSEADASGITFWDTADVYGGGHSESLIGTYLKPSKERPLVTTKLGRAGHIYPDGYTRENLRQSIVDSAKRLGVSKVDLIQLHCVPTAELERGDVFDMMNEFKDEGLIAQWGASVETIHEAQICLEQSELCSLQIIFNVFRQDAVWDLFPTALNKDVGIIVRLPLASGLLAGKYNRDTVFDSSDHRNYNKDGAFFSVGETFNGIPFETGLGLVETLRTLAPKTTTLSEFCMRWILDHPAVTTVIAGCSRPDQVVRNANVSELPDLGDDLHATLKDFYQSEVKQHIRCPI